MKLRENSGTVRYAALYFLLYCPLGILCPLISQYLNGIGFNGTQVGIITSMGTATAMIAGLFWGQIYSNSLRKKWILAFMCLMAAAFALLSRQMEQFFWYTLVYCGIYFFQGPVYGLCDSWIIGKGKDNFSTVRSFGAVGYAAAVFIAGKYAELTELGNIFYLYAAAFGGVFLLLLTEKDNKQLLPEGNEGKDKVRSSVLLKNKTYVNLMVCVFFVMGTNIANSTYFGYLFRDGGGDVAGIGLAFLLMAGSEAPFMALVPSLVRKFSSEKLILTAMMVSAARFALYSLGLSWKLLLATFFLQGIVNGILLVELVRYVGKVVEGRYIGIAISVFYVVGNCFSVIVCNLVGGILLDAAGAGAVYLFFSLYNIVAVVCYIRMGFHQQAGKRKRDKENDNN